MNRASIGTLLTLSCLCPAARHAVIAAVNLRRRPFVNCHRLHRRHHRRSRAYAYCSAARAASSVHLDLCYLNLLYSLYILYLYLPDMIPTPKNDCHECNLVLYCPISKRVCIQTSPLTSVCLKKDMKSSESCSTMGFILATDVGVFPVGRNARYPPKL